VAQVTVELRWLLTTNDFKLFDFDYQFDDAAYKTQLEQNIIDFFYDYEIGMETPDMFKRKFKAKWNRIMPYYNKLYNSTLLDYNPLTNQKLTEVLDQLATNNNTQTNNLTTTNNLTVDSTTNNHTFVDDDSKVSDYPQQPIAGSDYLQGQNNTTTDTTVDGTDHTTNTGTVANTGTIINDDTANLDYTKTIEGITGFTYPDLIMKHRDALIRINDRIIEEMKSCFILVF
jgi:hypothetical protein